MPRNLDLTALRSFVSVAETGGVTRAANTLNLTQSAVSMQIKRLEDALDVTLLDRSNRSISLTGEGEQLLGYARRMLSLNDEVWARLTAQEYEGEIRLGVPHDIIHPLVPRVLKRFAADFPRMRVRLISAPTRRLKAMFARGECEVIVTTEGLDTSEGEAMVTLPLVWIGAEGGQAWKERPVPLAFCSNCIFRGPVLDVLDTQGISWELVIDSEMDSAVEAAVSADLAVHALLDGDLPRGCVRVEHGGALPELPEQNINLYVSRPEDTAIAAMADIVRGAFRGRSSTPQLALTA